MRFASILFQRRNKLFPKESDIEVWKTPRRWKCSLKKFYRHRLNLCVKTANTVIYDYL